MNERFSAVEAKLEEVNPRAEIVALSEWVTRLESRTDPSAEKALISNNIVIQGLIQGDLVALEAVEYFIREEFGLSNAVADVREIDRYFDNLKILIVKLNSRAIRDDIMEQKSKLRQRKVYIEYELSPGEQ